MFMNDLTSPGAEMVFPCPVCGQLAQAELLEQVIEVYCPCCDIATEVLRPKKEKPKDPMYELKIAA
jgi:uncharacterized Zn finger protein (UPF0148 family)